MRELLGGVLFLVAAGTTLYLCFFRRGKQGLSELGGQVFTVMLGGGSRSWRTFAFVMSIFMIFAGIIFILSSQD